jgi:nitroimidazol reductase NimA-like FMN-containing flavoprotein (pyridoxamine 5'-phosphate oxidase superfamily)
MGSDLRELSEEAMRHPVRELKDQETIAAILRQALVGRIATINLKGFPVIKPLNFLYLDRKIYFHSSMKGEKIEDIRRGSPICFEVDQPIAYVNASKVACRANYYYRSIIVKGKASFVKDQDKKREILERMMEKYQPEGDSGEIPMEILKKTAVIEITVGKISGKENLG